MISPQSPPFQGRKTLILDLDETLVHSGFKCVREPDITLEVSMDGQTYFVYVLKRPGVDEFLHRMSLLYEVIIFTASIE